MKKWIIILLILVSVFGFASCHRQKPLTLDAVMALSEKGEELTWEDFAQYQSIETGSGLYILVYDIDDDFDLMIGGGNTETPPMYIRLVLKDDMDTYIDIRTENVKEFVEAHGK